MKIHDGRNSFYQWDLNQKLTSDTLQVGDEVHYSSAKQTKALVTVAYELNGNVVSDVPNILLQNAHLVRVERYIKTGNSEFTIKQYAFKVKPKAKPSDYIYTETEVKNWEEINTRLDEIEELVQKGDLGPITTDRIQNGAITLDKVSQHFFQDGINCVESEDIALYITQKMPNKNVDLFANIKSKISEITDESTNEIPTAKAVYDLVSQSKVKTITEPCHIADLDVGTYIIRNAGYGMEDQGKVVFENLDSEGKISEDYSCIYSGVLNILSKTVYEEEGGTTNAYMSFVATGDINMNGRTHTDDYGTDENGDIIVRTEAVAFENPLCIKVSILQAVKREQGSITEEWETQGYKADTWYSYCGGFVHSDVSASALDEVISSEPSNLRIPSSLAVKNYVDHNSPVKTITEPCHIADLEPGTYIVKNQLAGNYNGIVTITNVKEDNSTIDDDYIALQCGLLVVLGNVKNMEEDGSGTSIVSFIAQGLINVPDIAKSDDMSLQLTFNDANSIRGLLLQSYKLSETPEGAPENYEVGKWYSGLPTLTDSDIPARAITGKITETSTNFQVPSAKAVYDLGQIFRDESKIYTDNAIAQKSQIQMITWEDDD